MASGWGTLERRTARRCRFTSRTRRHRPIRGMTLVELLVVLAIIGILTSLLLPAVQRAREAGRRIACRNNLRQIGLAIHNFQNAQGDFPISFFAPRGRLQRGSWSIHARILPFLERGNEYGRVDLDVDWHEQVGTGVPGLGIPTYVCPSEPHPEPRMKDGSRYVHPISYGFNLGTWLIYDPITGRQGDGAFRVRYSTRPRDIRDGLSNTLCASEVRAYTSYIRNTQNPGPAIPQRPEELQSYTGELKLGPETHQNTGHTVWTDGRVHHTGFTTVFAPNQFVPYVIEGRTYDIDFNSQQEGRSLTEPSYAAVTTRSHHPGIVLSARMDGSVHAVDEQIDLQVWRSLGTRAGGYGR
jgi:prepilin-type N-terminal cleavage/methylation domain-containing protein